MNNVGGHALVLALLVLSVTATGGIVLTGSTAAADGDAGHRLTVQQPTADEGENETPPHRNPDNYSAEGDLKRVEQWLADRLSSRLGDGAIQLSEGQYDRASEYVGEEYRMQLEQYVDVAGQTAGEGHAEQFEKAGEQQARLSDAVREYRATKAQYEAARQAGNEDRARERARKLEALATEIASLGGSIRENYAEIEGATDADLSTPDAAIANTTETIQTEQASVREREFEETELRVWSDRESISFREPLIATGELWTGNGTPIANEEIRLAIGNQTKRVTTDAAGGFPLEYRPTDEPLTTDELTVRYVPDTQSPYLGTEATVNVSIDQVEPTVTIDNASSPVSYVETATVAGELTVDGIPVDGVTLAVTLDGQRIGTTTARNGTFTTAVAIPASVDDGEQELGVRLPLQEQALAAADATTTVTVRETESELSIEGTSMGDREIRLNGTLAPTGGRPLAAGDGLAGETVHIQIGGMTVGTLTTAADGSFGGTVSVPDSMADSDVSVTATYDGRGSNLAPATARTAVTVGDSGGLRSTAPWLAGGFVAVLAAGLGVWWSRRSPTEDPSPVSPTNDPGSTGGGATATDQPSAPSPTEIDSLLAQASDHLAAGRPDDAVQTGYAAVRRALASRIDAHGALTHWEFYQTYRATDAADATLLRDVTQDYERAAFGRNDVAPDEAATVLDRARQLCGREEPAADGVPAAD